MTALLEVLGQHFQAVERDLIVSGFHFYDIPSRLSWAEFESFVFAAPPGTATHTSRTGAWDRDSQMLDATRSVGGYAYGKPPVGGVRAGMKPQGQQPPPMRNMRGQNMRQEVIPQTDPNKQTRNLLASATAMPLSEFRERMEKRHAQWRAEALAKRGKSDSSAKDPDSSDPPGGGD